jgi:hypothetical protein
VGLFLNDSQIAALLAEPKMLPEDWRARMHLKPKRGHKERECDVPGQKGFTFRLILRQANLNPLDFSIILALLAPKSNQVLRLLRHNGRSHEHTNRIEGDTFYGFHVHRATERYQSEGLPEDGFAEITDNYSDFEGALESMMEDANFVRPQTPQMELPFPEGGQS